MRYVFNEQSHHRTNKLTDELQALVDEIEMIRADIEAINQSLRQTWSLLGKIQAKLAVDIRENEEVYNG